MELTGLKKDHFLKTKHGVHSKFVGTRERDTQKWFNSVLNAIYPILIQLEQTSKNNFSELKREFKYYYIKYYNVNFLNLIKSLL